MVDITYRLCDMKLGETAGVVEVEGDSRFRLMDLGFTKGTNITNILDAPCGDPKAFFVRGSVIALRKEDAQNILVRRG